MTETEQPNATDLPTGNPIGGIDYYTTGIGAVHLWGWALDPDSTASLDVAAFVGGSMVWAKANLSRSDVATQYPGFGPAHGWNIDLGGLPGGVQQICVSAANVGPGLSASLGCVNANVPDGVPEF